MYGSTRFKKDFREAKAALTIQGHIVGFFEKGKGIEITEEQEKMICSVKSLSLLTLALFGESTNNEIEYKKQKEKLCIIYRTINYFEEALWNSTKPHFYILIIAQTNL